MKSVKQKTYKTCCSANFSDVGDNVDDFDDPFEGW